MKVSVIEEKTDFGIACDVVLQYISERNDRKQNIVGM